MKVQVPDQVGGQYRPSTPATARFQGTGLPELARGIGGIVDKGLEIQRTAEKNHAQETLNAFREEKRDLLYNPDTGYYTTRGRSAYEKAPAVTESLGKLRDKYVSSLGSAYARELFSERADADILQDTTSIDRHSIAGNQQWQVETAQGAQQGAAEDATVLGGQTSVRRPDGTTENRLEARWRDGRAAVIDELKAKGLVDSQIKQAILSGKDIPADSIIAQSLRDFDSKFYANAISGQIDQNLPVAEVLMAQYGGYLRGGQYDAVAKQLKAKRDAVYVETTASNIIAATDSPSAALAATKDVPVELRAKVRGQVASLINLQKNAEALSQAKAFETLEQYRVDNPSLSGDALEAKYPTLWGQLSPELQEKLNHYETTHTNWSAYQKYLEMTPEQLKKAPLEPMLMYLALPERKQILRWRDAASNGTLTEDPVWAGIRTPLRVATDRAAALYPLPKGASEKEKGEIAGKRDAFISLVQARTRQMLSSGNKPSAEEISKAVDDVTQQTLKDAPGVWNALGRAVGMWGDTKVPVEAIKGFTASQLDTARRVFQSVSKIPVTAENIKFVAEDEMPDDVREEMDAHLKAAGKAITPENEYILFFRLAGEK